MPLFGQVASVSGDVRRALELCRRGAEIAESRIAAASSAAAEAAPSGTTAGTVATPPGNATTAETVTSVPVAAVNGGSGESGGGPNANGSSNPGSSTAAVTADVATAPTAGATCGEKGTGGASSSLITLSDIDAAVKEMFQSPNIQVMKRAARHEKIFLTALALELRRTGLAATSFE
eukprot:jgi/Mesen1/8890/ME000535S08209